MEGNGQDATPVLLQKLIDAVTGVRDEVANTNARLDQTNARLDQTNARLDQTNARLDQVVDKLEQTREELGGEIAATRTELRTEIAGVGARVDSVRTEVVALRLLARADDRELRDRVERIEQHLGLQPTA